MKLKKSDFNFIHYKVQKLNISDQLDNMKEDGEYRVESSFSKLHYKENFAYLGMKLTIQGNERTVEMEIIGFFEGFNEMGKEVFERFCYRSGVVNLLQAARSSLSAVTSVMNMQPPINLPLFNLKKSIAQHKKETEEKNSKHVQKEE